MNRLTKLAILIMSAAALMAPFSHAQDPNQLKTMQDFLNIMEGYFNVIESTHDVASDDEKAAIIHMTKLQEVYEQMGQKAKAADVFRNVLENSKNSTIRHAAFMMLADNLKETGRTDEAITILRQGLNESIANARP